MSYAIAGIFVIAFIAFVVLSAKAWHWSNILFLSLTFLAGAAATIAMAQVLDARYKQLKAVKETGEQLAQLEDQIDTLVYGPGFSYEYAPDSLRGLSQQLSLETEGRGRIWRNGSVSKKDANRDFGFSGNRIQAEEEPAKMQDMLLFAYADLPLEEAVYPVVFVGTFRVAGETPGSLELAPVFVSNTAEYENPSTTWTLFEKSPADQRDAFLRSAGIEIDPEDSNLNVQLTEYRELLESDIMPATIFNLDLEDQSQARQYEQLIDRVMFDGLPIVKIENWIESQPDRISQRFDPEAEEVFVRFQFQEKSNRSYQVDSTGNIQSDGQFTRGGQAVDPALHAGGEIEFQQGDEIYVDQLTADGYQRGDEPVEAFSKQEPVTEVARIYRRQLKDYPFLLQTLQRLTNEYTAEIERQKQNNARSQQAIADARTQEDKRAEVEQMLIEDQEKLKRDIGAIKSLVTDVKEQKNRLEMNIMRAEQEIRENHRLIKASARAIRARTGSRVGGNVLSSTSRSGN